MKIQILFLIIFCSYAYSTDKSLGWVIPDKKVFLPINVQTGFYGIQFPSFETVFKLAEKNLGYLEDTVANGLIFNKENEGKLYPLRELGIRLNLTSSEIKNTIVTLSEYLKNNEQFGQAYSKQKTIAFTINDLMPEGNFVEFQTYIIDLKMNKDLVPASGDEAQFREGLPFHKLESAASFLANYLTDYNKKLLSFLDMIRLFSGERSDIPKEQLFITQALEKRLNSEFELIRVAYFESSNNQATAILELALVSNYEPFTHLVGVQYQGYRLTNEFFSRENDLFELECISKYVCYPVVSKCSQAISNNSLAKILTNCNFQVSHQEFDILSSQGILINYEPKSKDIQQFLDQYDFEPDRYPALVQFNGCANFNKNQSKICFSTPNKIVYSRILSNDLAKYINPLWYTKLYNNLTDIPTILTFMILVGTTMLIYLLFELLNSLLTYMYHKYQSLMRTSCRMSRHRHRSHSCEKLRPVSKDRCRKRSSSNPNTRESRTKPI